MTKQISEERMVIHLVLESVDDGVSVACGTEYTVTSEGVIERKNYTSELSESEANAVKGFAVNRLREIEEVEGV